MVKWQHIHTVATTDISPDLGELFNIIDDVKVKTIPLHYHWECRTFQTASHIYGIHICLNTFNSCGWAYGSTLTPLPPPDLGEFAEILDDIISVVMIPVRYGWGCRTFQSASHIHEIDHITHTTWLSAMICCPWVYISSLVTQFYPHYLDQILRFWVTSDDVIMSWLRLTGFPHPY